MQPSKNDLKTNLNTTIVKVKLEDIHTQIGCMQNLNTTIVKVKLNLFYLWRLKTNLNTTIVKVKQHTKGSNRR